MASASTEMLPAIDIEELEVTETDAALLRELLEDESEKEELEKDRVKQIVRALEVELNADLDYDKHDRLEQTEELDVDGFKYYWPDMVEMAPNSPAVDETMGWYVDDRIGTGEFDCSIDCSQFYSDVFFEETTYGCLWQD